MQRVSHTESVAPAAAAAALSFNGGDTQAHRGPLLVNQDSINSAARVAQDVGRDEMTNPTVLQVRHVAACLAYRKSSPFFATVHAGSSQDSAA